MDARTKDQIVGFLLIAVGAQIGARTGPAVWEKVSDLAKRIDYALTHPLPSEDVAEMQGNYVALNQPVPVSGVLESEIRTYLSEHPGLFISPNIQDDFVLGFAYGGLAESVEALTITDTNLRIPNLAKPGLYEITLENPIDYTPEVAKHIARSLRDGFWLGSNARVMDGRIVGFELWAAREGAGYAGDMEELIQSYYQNFHT
jgi:hypothetical protein